MLAAGLHAHCRNCPSCPLEINLGYAGLDGFARASRGKDCPLKGISRNAG